MTSVSAYLNIFDDWAMLREAISSIAPFVDEIVVADGAYAWMVPYFSHIGRDPMRSDSRTWEALAPFSEKIRVISRIWQSEEEKRVAAYAACRGRWIIRVDADEISYLDTDAFDAWRLEESHPVAQAEMPVHVSPGLIRGAPGQLIERQSVYFDSNLVSAEDHTNYLWLVKSKERDGLSPDFKPSWVYPIPLGYLAHLTTWRPPATALGRARFYVLNYLRSTGEAVAGMPEFRYAEATGFSSLFECISASQLDEMLLFNPIVAGPPEIAGIGLLPSPRAQYEEESFSYLYSQLLAGLKDLNHSLSKDARTIGSGEPSYLDISTDEMWPYAMIDSQIALDFSEPVGTIFCAVQLTTVEAPWLVEIFAECQIISTRVTITLPDEFFSGAFIRRSLKFSAWPERPAPRFSVMAVPM